MLNPSPAAAPAFGNEREPSSLADRVQRVLVPGYRPSLRLTWRTMLAAMALGVVMLGLLAVGARETVAATATLVSGAEKQPSTTAAWTNIPGLEPKELDQIESAIQKWLAIPVAERPSGTNVVGVLLNAQHLVQNGKLAYEAGRLDEARRLFKYALVVDSDNVAAKYYLDVMEQQERRVPAQALQLPSISVASESATFNPSEKALTARGNVEITAANGMKITTEEARIQLGTNSAAIGANTNLYTRTFKVNTNEFTRTLGLVGAVAPTNFQAAVHNFFSNLGVDLMAPGISFFYGERSGMLLVRATLADLDIVEQALQVMNTPAPQVNIQARFVEMTQNDAKAMGFDWFMGNSSIVGTNLVHHPQSIGKFSLTSNLLTGILTPPQFKVVLRALEQREGVELLSAPDITTMSGRQAQIQVVDMKTLVTGETPLITDGMEVRLLQTTNMPFGPVLDVFPHVSTDGYSVQMTLIPSVTEFLGYDKPDATLTNFPMEKLLSADLPLPHYRLRQAVAQVNVWDGQTIVIGGLTSEIVTRQPDGSTTKNPDPKPQKKQLFVFITPTIIDPAGNRVHADEEMAGKVGAAPKSNPVFPGPLVPTEGEKIRDWPAVPSKLPKDWK